MDAVTRGLIRRLVHVPKDPGLRAAILARGAAAVAPLVELLQDRTLWWKDSPGGGNAAVTAANLLGELRAPEAVDPLVAALGELDAEDTLYSTVVFALAAIGPAAAEPVLALALDAEAFPDEFDDGDGTLLGGCLEVLVQVAKGDDRVFDLLCRSVRADLWHAADLAEFGDARALPVLHELADGYEREAGDHLLTDQEWIELYAAIEEFGDPTASERAMHEAVLAHRLSLRQGT